MTKETSLLSNELTRTGICCSSRDHELHRIVKPSVDELVNAESYFTGRKDIARLFSCELETKVWKQHLDPFMVHAVRNPDCAFIMGNCNGSRPDYVPSEENNVVTFNQHFVKSTSDVPSSVTLNGSSPFIRTGLIMSTPQEIIPCGSSVTGHNSESLDINNTACCQHWSATASDVITDRRKTFAGDGIPALERRNSISNVREPYPKPHLQRAKSDVTDHYLKMNSGIISRGQNSNFAIISRGQHSNSGFEIAKFRESESARIQTFNLWIGLTPSRVKEFAQAGFMYIGPGDQVKCVFCGGILQNWKNDELPLQKHYKYYPECNFAMESFSATLIPKPRHSKYKLEPVRLSSFYDWDPAWNPKPAALAKAGFFYTGNGDRVRCFFCNGALCKWEPHDDPWREHARWFPKCPYVKQSKGQSFISEVSSGMTLAKRQAISLDKTDKKTVAMKNHLLLLAQENKLMKKQKQCKVCLDKEVCVTFIPCGHLVCCLSCASALQQCPICRAKIKKMVRIYMS